MTEVRRSNQDPMSCQNRFAPTDLLGVEIGGQEMVAILERDDM